MSVVLKARDYVNRQKKKLNDEMKIQNTHAIPNIN